MSMTKPSSYRLGWASLLIVGFLFAAALMVADANAQPAGKGKAKKERKPSPALSSLPKPAAAGPLKILVVDDDWSDNNAPGRADAALSRSDKVFRQLAAAAVGGDATRWSVTLTELYRNGPDIARLRDFNVVIWYNGGAYGGNPDNSSVLSREDEKTARRYLEEAGGTFILVSPGHLSNFQYGNSWTQAPVPFLTEVVGIDGFTALAQRFDPGVVTAWDGNRYNVAALGHPEAQFSAVNPDGAAIVFSATLDPLKTANGPVAVAVAHPYGRGRFVYVGFSFENLPESELSPAFARLLDAGGWPIAAAPVATSGQTPPPPISPTPASGSLPIGERIPVDRPLLPTRTATSSTASSTSTSTPPPESTSAPLRVDPALRDIAVRDRTGTATVITGNADLPPPTSEPPTTSSPPASNTTSGNNGRPASIEQLLNSPPPTIRSAKVRIFTGNDNKEAPSNANIHLTRNGGEPDDPFGFDITIKNPLRLTSLGSAGLSGKELAVNSTHEFVLRDPKSFNTTTPELYPSLASCEEHGLRLEISYEPNFFLDAWRINRIELEIDFASREHWRIQTWNNRAGRYDTNYQLVIRSAPGFPKVITFITGGLMNNTNKQLTYITDRFFMQKF